MEISDYIQMILDIYHIILEFIDNGVDDDLNIQELFLNIDKEFDDVKLILLIISKICENHFRFPYFFKKIEAIILHFESKIKQNFKNDEIYQLFKGNQRILLFLIQKNIMLPVDEIKYNLYFYPEAKHLIRNKEKEIFETQFNKSYQIESFEEKRLIGENDSYICTLIRNDSIVEFIQYINKYSIGFSSKIPYSIYETNLFLQEHQNTSLIEYAAFYGSIRIFQYLKRSGAKIEPSIWLYSIHGQNTEIIQLLEDDHIPQNHTVCFEEAIKCHHNAIAQYIQDNGREFIVTYEVPFGFHYYNFDFISDDIFSTQHLFFYLCKYNYYSIAKLYLKSKNIDSSFLINIDDYKISKYRKCIEILCSVDNIKTGNEYLIKYSYNENEANPQFELECQMNIKYPCILELVGYNQDYGKQIFLYKYMPNGTLQDYINSKSIEKTSTRNYILLLGIAIVMRFLDQKHIANEQFYPNKILIDENFYPVIFDYASNPVYDATDDVDHFSKSNYIYVAPKKFEYYFDEIHLNEYSVYSYAMMFYIIVTGQYPIKNKKIFSIYQMMREVKKGLDLDFSAIKNRIVFDFISNCLDESSQNKMNFDEIVNFITNKEFYSFFENLDHDSVKKFLNIFGDEFNYLKNKF